MKKSTTFSLPNLLTFGRILAVPALVICMLWPDSDTARWTALGIFAAAAITDFFDGYLARILNVQSALGRMLDPIADKLLVTISILMLAAADTLNGFHIWAGVIIVCREILVSGLREFLAELQVSVPVTRLAKWKTTAQLVALGFLLAGPAGDKVLPFNTEIGLTLMWISALLTLYTGYDYFRAGIHYLLDD
ncbi:CDP-diacylglycerol--glycerol-3-phosphate 3-phosphatidyltransferase [Cohaesibacter gelatinilyticus]|uniref:CDP-diacylglycerol--glycerol-3-phosphate 3-phosphatidyltransferase n=1 Tax=Cohaesibacter gelatinilyticus TaxID=372072 RepID=A0A285PGP4_9HYPH|nr:CDP-diacylglycerol--glycerol-3-phosphate 3-phosphatidyltransferase [Cohaesibacter gelatinilyticus]SNZ20864.1 CDP-diacylglycerol--glycerol-3-phosphate 3-phosphatidyltransferase [Cohaesibacter gelatinilyticus]HAT87167.1 CDP-diacylglycerol--glycerol-3-phosphate 3-phosphatidyltransferase [Hyphomicrobiales bacterium]